MFERSNLALRLISAALSALIVWQIAHLLARKDPVGPLALSSNLVWPSKTTDSEVKTVSVGTNSPGRKGSPGKEATLPAAIQARVDKITQSEILGAIVKPLPMALLGIAGQDAFIRAPNGQTGLVREGEEFGGIKLLRIGTNRVLIEHEQQQKELTLFSGFGGASLLSKPEKNFTESAPNP
jgi:hypothetical protein